MLRGDWFKRFKIELAILIAVLALIPWSIAVWKLAQHDLYYAQSAEHQASKYGPSSDDQPESSCAAISGLGDVVDCVVQKIAASRETQRREQDLAAQQGMAEWALWIVILTGAQAALSLLGVVLLVRNLGLAREANEVAREVGRDQTRAYVYVEKVEYTGDSTNPFVAWIKNGGQTPAKEVQSFIFLGVTSKTKNKIVRPDDLRAFNWGLIGPGDSIRASINHKTIGNVLIEYVDVGESRSLNAVGTVEYETIYGEKFKTDAIFTTSALFDAAKRFSLDISIQEGTEAFVPRPQSKEQ